MKKTFVLVGFCCLFLFGCPPPIEMTSFQKINYEAYTRGSSEQIILEQGKLKHFQNQKEVLSKTLYKKNYKTIYRILNSINLENIDKVEAPSKKHQFDGAMYATLEITAKGTTYKSQGFDDDNPPKEFEELLKYLQSLVKH